MNKLKILFLTANPKGTEPLDLANESHEIMDALQRGEHRNKFDLIQRRATRISELQRYLMEASPHIVHISGHGNNHSEIILQNDQGVAQPVPKQALKDLFHILGGNIHCVVINTCYSEAQANAIADNIDCVIGMSGAVKDDVAINFSKSFYQALSFGKSIQDAFNLGRNQINLGNLGEQDRPKLITKGVDPATVFLIISSGNRHIQNNLKQTTIVQGKTGGKNDELWKIATVGSFLVLLLVTVFTYFPPFVNPFGEKATPTKSPTFTEAERTVVQLKRENDILRGQFESRDDYEASTRAIQKDAASLGQNLSMIQDENLGLKFRVLKYENIEYAFVMATNVTSDPELKRDYTNKAILAGEKALLSIEEVLERTRGGGAKAQKDNQWIQKDKMEERVLYALAVAYSIKVKLGDSSLITKTHKTIDKIPTYYKKDYPIETDENLKWFIDNH